MEFEEKYLRVRDENVALKKKKNEQEATIKRMFTKMAMIEEALKKKRQSEQPDNQDDADARGLFSKRDVEAEQFVLALKGENAALRKKTQSIAEKNRALEQKLQQQQQHKRTRVATTRPASAAIPSGRHQVEKARESHRASSSSALEVALKSRMVTAEKQVLALHQQNQTLRKSLQRQPHHNNQNPDDDHEDEADEKDQEEDEGKEAVEQALNRLRIQQLERELGDRQAQLVLLNARFDALEAKASAERDIQQSTLCQLEKTNQTLHKLRNQLQDAQIECQHEKARASKLNEMTREMNLLRDQNRKLEERMTSLCESPFINDAFQRKERIDKLLELEKTTRQQQEALMQLNQERARLELFVRDLQSQLESSKRTNQSLDKELQATKTQLAHEQERHALALNAITSNQMNLRLATSPSARLKPQASLVEKRDASSSPLKVQQSASRSETAATEIPFTKVARKYDSTAAFGESLEPTSSGSIDSVKHLRNRLHMLQIAHLKTTQELERCEKMMETQMTINRELTMEIEQLTTQKVSGTKLLQQKFREMETLAEERQQRIETLEALVRQLRYSVKQQEDTVDDTSEAEEDEDLASQCESLELAARSLAPGEHLLELWIVSGAFDKSVVSGTTSTFVLCDFFDFESQSTPLLTGNRPAYNFSATFKVTVDGFFLRFLASDTLQLEVHQAVRGDFRLFGFCSLQLAGLLSSRGSIRENAAVVRSVSNREVVLGTLHVVVRLSTPISEVWKLHLQSYPQDAQLLDRGSKPTPSPDASTSIWGFDDHDDSTTSSNANELQIAVTGCRHLRSYGVKRDGARRNLSRVPSAYVHYQLLGFPDVFTNIVPENTNPEFDPKTSKQFFVLHVDGCLLRFFEKFTLCFTVFDDKIEIHSSSSCSNDDMIGHCSISLFELAKGELIQGWFPLHDRDDKPAGEISLSITWKDPFAVFQLSREGISLRQREFVMSMHSLDLEQAHALVIGFARSTDGKVNYEQFLLYATPPQVLELVLHAIRDGFEVAIENRQLQAVEDAFPRDPNRNRPKQTISIKQFKSILGRFGMSLSEQELRLVQNSFGDASSALPATVSPSTQSEELDGSNFIQVHFLLLHINPRRRCAERLLQHKVRHTITNFLLQSNQRCHPMEVFRKADPENSRHVSRAVFKRCLTALGFQLLGLEDEFRELLKKSTKEQEFDSPTRGEEPPKDTKSTDGLENEILDDAVSVQTETLVTHATSKQQLETHHPTRSAMAEFQQRKAAFLDRMKTITAVSNRSVVYENLEPKIREKLQQSAHQVVTNQQLIQQRMEQLPALHEKQNVAALVLQRKFREYFTAQRQQQSQSTITIIDVHNELESCFESWSDRQVMELREELLERIRAVTKPDDRAPAFVSRKQLGFVLSNVSRFALKPSSLRILMDHFDVSRHSRSTHKDAAGRVDYEALVGFVCEAKSFSQNHFIDRNPGLKRITELLVNIPALSIAFRKADPMSSGRVSFAAFQKCLQQCGVRLSSSLLRMVILLFDWNGVEVLYRSFLWFLTSLPVAQQLARLAAKLRRVGAAMIGEQLLLHVESDDGLMTKQQLMEVVTLAKRADLVQLTTAESSLLFDCLDLGREGRIRVQALVDFVQYSEQVEERQDDTTKGEFTDMTRIKCLAINARRLVSCSFAQAVDAFKRFDWEERGLVSVQEFLFVADRMVFGVLSSRQLEAIAKQFGGRVDGRFGVKYRGVLEWATPQTPPGIEEIEQKLRDFVREKAQAPDGRPTGELAAGKGAVSELMASWKKAFMAQDSGSKTGFVSRKGFARICIETLGLPLSTEEMRVILYAYDHHLADTVSYESFLKLSWKQSVSSEKQSQSSIEKSTISGTSVIKDIQQALKEQNAGYREVIQVFQRLRSEISTGHASHHVDKAQFLLGMRQLGVQLSPESVHALFLECGDKAHARRVLDYDNWLRQDMGLPAPLAPESSMTSSTTETNTSAFRSLNDEQQRVDVLLQNASKYSQHQFEEAFEAFEQLCKGVGFQQVDHARAWKLVESSGLTRVLLPKGAGLLLKRFLRNDNTVPLKALHCYIKSFISNDPHRKELSRSAPGSHRLSIASSPRKRQVEKCDGPPKCPLPLEQRIKQALQIAEKLLDTCDANGVDARGVFEHYDLTHTGRVSAFEFKSAMHELGIQRFTTQALGWDMIVGLLVRHFRIQEDQDHVCYLKMLQLRSRSDSSSSLEVKLRAHLRIKAGLQGQIPCSPHVYSQLDQCFALFDRDAKGFISMDQLKAGLVSLDFGPLDAYQLRDLASCMAIYRVPSGNAISRCEFDSFVLDPDGNALMDRIAQRLYEHKEPDGPSGQVMPRIAVLSRACQARDQHNDGLLPTSEAIQCLETALSKPLSSKECFCLQHLFDVDRNGSFAYKLLFKSACHRSSSSGWKQSIAPVAPFTRAGSSKANLKDPATKQVLRTLHQQLCTIDFNQQLKVLRGYLDAKDNDRNGDVAKRQLLDIFESIGISISHPEAHQLKTHYRTNSSKPTRISYRRLLEDLVVLHERR